jgi:hypothetical protein
MACMKKKTHEETILVQNILHLFCFAPPTPTTTHVSLFVYVVPDMGPPILINFELLANVRGNEVYVHV